jgi:hypothetical protein
MGLSRLRKAKTYAEGTSLQNLQVVTTADWNDCQFFTLRICRLAISLSFEFSLSSNSDSVINAASKSRSFAPSHERIVVYFCDSGCGSFERAYLTNSTHSSLLENERQFGKRKKNSFDA